MRTVIGFWAVIAVIVFILVLLDTYRYTEFMRECRALGRGEFSCWLEYETLKE